MTTLKKGDRRELLQQVAEARAKRKSSSEESASPAAKKKSGEAQKAGKNTPRVEPQTIAAAARRTNHPGAKPEERPAPSLMKPAPKTNPRDISTESLSSGGQPATDRLALMVRDPYWLHVYWDLTCQTIQRTQAALGPDWYTAKPILRLLDVSCEDGSNAAEMAERDITIHGGVNNWYIDVNKPCASYRVDIGYLTARGRFYVICRSNVVTMPRPGTNDAVDEHWRSLGADYERVFALSRGSDPGNASAELRSLFEERLRRPMSSGTLSDFGPGAMDERRAQEFYFDLDAELIVYGRTIPNAHVTLQGEPIQLRSDGTFTLRYCLPDGRQILPATAQTPDGLEERTIILAMERNTKHLEPYIHDGQEQ